MRIGFYTWGDPVMGMGHVFRCLALARAFRASLADVDIVFEMKDREPGAGVALAAGEQVRRWADTAIPEGSWDILVVDQLRVAADEIAALRHRCRCLVSLDDAGPGHWQADIAISSLYRCTAPRPGDSRTTSCFGAEFALIDAAFAARPYTVREEVSTLFLTQGGSDTWNGLTRLVEQLTPWLARRPRITLDIHTGPGFEHEEALTAALDNLHTPWRRHGRVSDLAALMGGMDLAIAAGGVMTFELMAVGVPCITVTAETKERETTAALAEAGVTVDLGGFDDGLGNRLRAALDALLPCAARTLLSARGRARLDGKGAERIVEIALRHMYAAGQTEDKNNG